MTSVVTSAILRSRTQAFALEMIRLTDALPRTRSADVIARQVIRSGTSIAANYRAACRARSRREFIAKLGIVEEEADETVFWLDLLAQAGLGNQEHVTTLKQQANEFVAITVASIRTARMGRGGRKANPQSAIGNPQCS